MIQAMLSLAAEATVSADLDGTMAICSDKEDSFDELSAP